MMKYLALMEPRKDMLADVEGFIFEATNLMEAKQVVADKDLGDYKVYVQALNSLWLHHPERRNKIH
jgi:hypothetical protein